MKPLPFVLRSKLPIFIVLILLGIALFVIFYLPDFIEPKTPKSKISGSNNPNPEYASGTRGNKSTKTDFALLSPSEQIRQLRYRSKAEESLSVAIDVQLKLEELKVNIWAPEEYAQAQQMIIDGDTTFKENSYNLATEHYILAGSFLQEIFDSIPQRTGQYNIKSLELLERGEIEAAREKINTAIVLNPKNTTARRILQRISVRKEVIARLNAGELELQAQNYDVARQEFRLAIELDDEYNPALGALKNVNEKIFDAKFNALVAAGIVALQSNDIAKAKVAFNEAGTLKPNDPGLLAAVKSLNNKNRLATIQHLTDQANDAEANEQWDKSLKSFNQILDIYPGSLLARQGKERTGSRLALDKKFSQYLANPIQLGNKNIYQQASLLYNKALQLPNKGARLSTQLDKLKTALRQVLIPARLTLISDNKTFIKIYKEKPNLGRFLQKNLELKPGIYNIHGSRDGYRDVEKTVHIELGQTAVSIKISCVEKV